MNNKFYANNSPFPMHYFFAYYCFNLEYPPMSKDVLYFIQDYILDHPDSRKKSGGYLAIVSDIKRNL